MQVHHRVSAAGALTHDHSSLHRSIEESVLVRRQPREGVGLDHYPSFEKDALPHDQIPEEIVLACRRISGRDILVHDQVPEEGGFERREGSEENRLGRGCFAWNQ